MAAAEVLGRTAFGCEISPGYCDVILRRLMNLGGEAPVLAPVGTAFADVASGRGVDLAQVLNPKTADARAIKHNGPNPFYDRRRKAS